MKKKKKNPGRLESLGQRRAGSLRCALRPYRLILLHTTVTVTKYKTLILDGKGEIGAKEETIKQEQKKKSIFFPSSRGGL